MKTTTLLLLLCMIVGVSCETESSSTSIQKEIRQRGRNSRTRVLSKGKGGPRKSKKNKKGSVYDGSGGGDSLQSTSSSEQFLLKQSDHPGMCMTYGPNQGKPPLRLVSCSSSSYESLWEKVMVTENLFKLRHYDSQLCIPQNPEFPSFPFDCFDSLGGIDMASADSINGLVNCDSDYAAIVGTIISMTGDVMLGLTSCMEKDHHIIILMTYVDDDDDSIVVLWGEEILLALDEEDVEQYKLAANWVLEDPST